MRIHYIQHVPFEGLGFIEQWLTGHAHTITGTRIWENDSFPPPDSFDLLIVMGGPMGVYDDHLYTWLAEEKNFIHTAIQSDKKIIGICLGAQLLACVLGATVFTNKHKEIGWFPVSFDTSLEQWLGSALPAQMTVFHWHGDKFDNPYGGIIHASSAACNHQVFTYGDHMIGLQFHPEATPATIDNMLQHCGAELTEAPFIQSAKAIAQYQSFQEPHHLMQLILEKMCRGK